MQKYKAVIFDFDDTLVETRLIKWAHHTHVAKKFYDIDLTEETLLKHWGKPFNTLVRELYQDKDSLENLTKANLSVRENFRKKVYPGSLDTVKKLLNNDIKIGVLSATNKSFMLEDFEIHGFPIKDISFIQGADETSVHKPDPQVFAPILDKFKREGIGKEEIIYIGDSLDDLRAAKGAGIDFIAVTTGLYTADDFKSAGAEYIVENIQEVTKFLLD